MGLLVIEFRAHAARVPDLNRRYAELHSRTVERLTGFFSRLHEQPGAEPRLPARTMAEFVLAVGSGTVLERLAEPAALPGPVFADIISQTVTAAASQPGVAAGLASLAGPAAAAQPATG